MKVFYEEKTWRPLQPGEPEIASIEDVEFPEELFEELGIALERSQRVLPPTARKFKGWEVGLLQRFDGGDLLVRKEGAGEGEDDGLDEGNEADGEDEGEEAGGEDVGHGGDEADGEDKGDGEEEVLK